MGCAALFCGGADGWQSIGQKEFIQQTTGLCHTSLFGQNIAGTAPTLAARKVNGFWGGVCQDVLISEPVLAKNSIDCRIFFADNARRIMQGERPRAASAGKTFEMPGKASNPAVCGPSLGPQLPRPHVV